MTDAHEYAPEEFAIHLAPVRRARANFIIMTDIAEEGQVKRWEQLWARQISDDCFELCCIPFFAYNLMLGDVVRTGWAGGMQYVVQEVVQSSGHFSFRIWFGDTNSSDARREVPEHLQAINCELEWSSENLLAVDVSTEEVAQTVADFLAERERDGQLVYETGRI